MLALRLKPEATDKYRKYWNMYHQFLGYALLALISVNIFQGIAILKPDHTWKWAYIGVLGALAAITLAFQICTWVKFLQSSKKEKEKEEDNNKSDAQAPTGKGPLNGGGLPLVGDGGGGHPSGGGGGEGPPKLIEEV